VGAIGWAPAIACAALFLVVVTPWLFRQLDVYGSLLPGSRTLWLTDYQHLFSFANVPTLDSWLSQGLGQLLSSRIAALLSAVGLFALLPLAVVLAPLGIVGAWVNRRSPAFQPYFFYGAALLAVMVLAFAVLVPHGTFLHASSALVPHTFLLVLAGIAAAVRWVAARRATWSGATATRVFSVAAVAIAFLAAALQTALATRQWADVRQVHTSVAAAMAGAPSSDRFMAVDPGAINYLTGRQGVVTPHDELPVIETVMRQYGIRWLVLESNSIVPALEPVLRGSVRPTWLSSPVAVVAEESQPSLAINASRTIGVPPAAVALPVPAAALYAVCLEATDPRCAQ
jgi:hypothetical protein